jgi:excinuclease ABC subunit B
VLVTTLTKRMAEDLTEYLHEQGVRVRYMHSDIDTLERIEIIRDLRLGRSTCWSASTCCARGSTFPNARWSRSSTPTRKASCARETSLIQTIGRAARNIDGR